MGQAYLIAQGIAMQSSPKSVSMCNNNAIQMIVVETVFGPPASVYKGKMHNRRNIQGRRPFINFLDGARFNSGGDTAGIKYQYCYGV
jgi:hypothetical protein